MPTAKMVPLGKDNLSPITGDIPAPTQAELDLIIANWNAYAPAKYRGLMEARPVGTDDPKARWFYDAQRRRYISKSGHVVSPDELNKAYLAYRKAKDKA
jgi:hypothetical protein